MADAILINASSGAIVLNASTGAIITTSNASGCSCCVTTKYQLQVCGGSLSTYYLTSGDLVGGITVGSTVDLADDNQCYVVTNTSGGTIHATTLFSVTNCSDYYCSNAPCGCVSYNAASGGMIPSSLLVSGNLFSTCGCAAAPGLPLVYGGGLTCAWNSPAFPTPYIWCDGNSHAGFIRPNYQLVLSPASGVKPCLWSFNLNVYWVPSDSGSGANLIASYEKTLGGGPIGSYTLTGYTLTPSIATCAIGTPPTTILIS